jgi:hypothetical protein
MSLIYRQDRLFRINSAELPESANTLEARQNLLVAIFKEFQGAMENESYKNMTNKERLEALNNFAKAWLLKQGYK